MNIIILKDKDAVSKKGAEIIKAQINGKLNSVLGLATGSTPLGIYKYLIDYYKNDEISFKNIVSFNLDEYVGLPVEDKNSYINFMKENLFDEIDINPENINIPNGNTADVEKESQNYENKINSFGGVDLQLLGLGHNGHIGFNEPGAKFKLYTHLIDLSDETIEANKRFFDKVDDVPRQAITMGIKTIFKAKKILLVALGEGKSDIINKLLSGEISPDLQASILHLHPNVTILLDEEAASKLSNIEDKKNLKKSEVLHDDKVIKIISLK